MPHQSEEHETPDKHAEGVERTPYQPAEKEEPFLDSLSDYEIGVRRWITDTMKGS